VPLSASLQSERDADSTEIVGIVLSSTVAVTGDRTLWNPRKPGQLSCADLLFFHISADRSSYGIIKLFTQTPCTIDYYIIIGLALRLVFSFTWGSLYVVFIKHLRPFLSDGNVQMNTVRLSIGINRPTTKHHSFI